jgi:hypothetical protein
MSQWYYSSGGTQNGPVDDAALKELAKNGGLTPTDMVWKEGMGEWLPASKLKGLFPAGTEAAPAPMPAAPMAAAPLSSAAAIAGFAPAPQPAVGYASPAMLGYHSGGGGGPVTPRTVELLRQTKPWVRLMSILLFLIGGLFVVFGLIFMVGMTALGGMRGGGAGAVLGLVYVALAALYVVPGLFLSRYASRISILVGSGRADDLESALEAQKSFWKFVGIAVAVVIGFYVVILGGALLIGALR